MGHPPSASFGASPSSGILAGGTDQSGGLITPWITAYKYDNLGNLTQVDQKGTEPNDSSKWRTRLFTYNSLGQLRTAYNPESGTITYDYDDDGNLKTKISPAPNQIGAATQTILYCYDALHRIIGKYYFSPADCQTGFAVSYGYDQTSYNGLTIANGIGRRTGMSDASGMTAWSYDIMGRPLNELRTIAGVTKGLTYQYNYDGSPKSLLYPSGALLEYSYNDIGHLTSAIDHGNSINYADQGAYNAPGALTSLKLGDSGTFAGYTIANQYNPRLQPTVLSADKPGATIFSRTYSYGTQNNGNILQILNNLDHSRDVSYSYDALNRLTTAESGGWANQYTVDAWGNLTKSLVFDSKPEGQHLDQTANEKNQFVGFCYDAAGNLLQQGSCPMDLNLATHHYDQENRLSSLPQDGASYVYDGDGVRVKKSGGTSTPMLYWGESFTAGPIAETDLTGTIKAEYVYFEGKRIARRDISSGAVSYYFSDHLNSANLVADSTGIVTDESDFYPFGGERVIVAGTGNHFKFTGKERDEPALGLDNFGARYYGSTLGRFLTADWTDSATGVPFANFEDPQSLNLYSYVRNSPSDLADIDGHQCTIDGETHGFWWCLGHSLKAVQTEKEKVDEARNFFRNNEVVDDNGQKVDGSKLSDKQILQAYRNLRTAAPDASLLGALGQAAGSLTYEGSPKHGSTPQGNVSQKPSNPDLVLKDSIQYKDTSSARVGVDSSTGEYVIFRETNPGTGNFHGYATKNFNELPNEAKAALIKAGKVSQSGKIR